MTRHFRVPETDEGLTSDQPEMASGRGRGRSLALIIESGYPPVEVVSNSQYNNDYTLTNQQQFYNYNNHGRRLDSTVSFNSVWVAG